MLFVKRQKDKKYQHTREKNIKNRNEQNIIKKASYKQSNTANRFFCFDLNTWLNQLSY